MKHAYLNFPKIGILSELLWIKSIVILRMFKVIWDTEYNGVRLTMSSKGDALNVTPRPVFWEELDLLGLNKQGWIYPHVEEPLLWACDRRYFYKGKLVLEVKGGNVFDAPVVIIQEGCEGLVLESVDIDARDYASTILFDIVLIGGWDKVKEVKA